MATPSASMPRSSTSQPSAPTDCAASTSRRLPWRCAASEMARTSVTNPGLNDTCGIVTKAVRSSIAAASASTGIFPSSGSTVLTSIPLSVRRFSQRNTLFGCSSSGQNTTLSPAFQRRLEASRFSASDTFLVTATSSACAPISSAMPSLQRSTDSRCAALSPRPVSDAST